MIDPYKIQQMSQLARQQNRQSGDDMWKLIERTQMLDDRQLLEEQRDINRQASQYSSTILGNMQEHSRSVPGANEADVFLAQQQAIVSDPNFQSFRPEVQEKILEQMNQRALTAVKNLQASNDTANAQRVLQAIGSPSAAGDQLSRSVAEAAQRGDLQGVISTLQEGGINISLDEEGNVNWMGGTLAPAQFLYEIYQTRDKPDAVHNLLQAVTGSIAEDQRLSREQQLLDRVYPNRTAQSSPNVLAGFSVNQPGPAGLDPSSPTGVQPPSDSTVPQAGTTPAQGTSQTPTPVSPLEQLSQIQQQAQDIQEPINIPGVTSGFNRFTGRLKATHDRVSAANQAFYVSAQAAGEINQKSSLLAAKVSARQPVSPQEIQTVIDEARSLMSAIDDASETYGRTGRFANSAGTLGSLQRTIERLTKIQEFLNYSSDGVLGSKGSL